MSDHRADAHRESRSHHPKLIRRSYLTFLAPDARPQNDFIDQWQFSIDEPNRAPEPEPQNDVETFEATVVDPRPATMTPALPAPVSGQRAMAQSFPAATRRIAAAPEPPERVSREDLLAMRRELMETAQRVDRAVAVIDRWLGLRRAG